MSNTPSRGYGKKERGRHGANAGVGFATVELPSAALLEKAIRMKAIEVPNPVVDDCEFFLASADGGKTWKRIESIICPYKGADIALCSADGVVSLALPRAQAVDIIEVGEDGHYGQR